MQQIETTKYLRSVTQALHKIAEELATREIEIDPKEFVRRETITRNINKYKDGSGGADTSTSHGFYLNTSQRSQKS